MQLHPSTGRSVGVIYVQGGVKTPGRHGVVQVHRWPVQVLAWSLLLVPSGQVVSFQDRAGEDGVPGVGAGQIGVAGVRAGEHAVPQVGACQRGADELRFPKSIEKLSTRQVHTREVDASKVRPRSFSLNEVAEEGTPRRLAPVQIAVDSLYAPSNCGFRYVTPVKFGGRG